VVCVSAFRQFNGENPLTRIREIPNSVGAASVLYWNKNSLMNTLRKIFNLLKLTYQEWQEDDASQLAAALAYYTTFSLAPILVIAIAIAGRIWRQAAIKAQVLNEIQGLVGKQGADLVASLINNASNPSTGTLAAVIGTVSLIFGALGVFNQLHNTLNIIWEVEAKETQGFINSIKELVIARLLSLTMVLGIGFLLLVSLVLSAGVSAVQGFVSSNFFFPPLLLQIINLLVSIGLITVFFALIYKFLPDAEVAWQDVWLGAAVTSMLFSLGKLGLGLYLGNRAFSSTFGAAGSLVLILVWIYYSAQILFFGAEFTQVYANQYGSRIRPEEAWAISRIEVPGKINTPEAAGGLQESPSPPPQSAPSYQELSAGKEGYQAIRLVIGMMTASFLAGMLTIWGLKDGKSPSDK
jgi:membrane protein